MKLSFITESDLKMDKARITKNIELSLFMKKYFNEGSLLIRFPFPSWTWPLFYLYVI